MIRISILYPNIENGRFDKDYYLNIHMPLSRVGLKGISVETGINGGNPETKAPYVAMSFII